MPWTLDARFKIPANKAVVAFIEREQPSAHDDIATALTNSAKGLSDAKWYCPDVHAYAYFVLHVASNRIFGIAFGMNGLAYRVPKQMGEAAIAEGGTPADTIGDEWFLFEPFQGETNKWCKIAHEYAVECPSKMRS